MTADQAAAEEAADQAAAVEAADQAAAEEATADHSASLVVRLSAAEAVFHSAVVEVLDSVATEAVATEAVSASDLEVVLVEAVAVSATYSEVVVAVFSDAVAVFSDEVAVFIDVVSVAVSAAALAVPYAASVVASAAAAAVCSDPAAVSNESAVAADSAAAPCTSLCWIESAAARMSSSERGLARAHASRIAVGSIRKFQWLMRVDTYIGSGLFYKEHIATFFRSAAGFRGVVFTFGLEGFQYVAGHAYFQGFRH